MTLLRTFFDNEPVFAHHAFTAAYLERGRCVARTLCIRCGKPFLDHAGNWEHILLADQMQVREMNQVRAEINNLLDKFE